MDDMNAFERQVAGEVIRAAASARPVDVAAVFTAITATQSPKWRFQSMFSATKFVLAGAIVALFGGFLLAGLLTQPSSEQLPAVGASASSSAEPAPDAEADSATTKPDLLPGVDLVTETVEPGVERIISDGAGHDLDALRLASPTRKEGIAITPDGTVWVATASSSNVGGGPTSNPSVLALGKPGLVSVPEGVWAQTETPILLVSDTEGTLLFVADAVARLDGEAFVPDDGPLTRPLRAGGTLWLIRPDELAGLLPEDEFRWVCTECGVLPVVRDGWKWISLPEYGSRVLGASFSGLSKTGDPLGTACWTDGDGVTCIADESGRRAHYLAGTDISQLEQAPDGSIWAVGQRGDEGIGLYRISRM